MIGYSTEHLFQLRIPTSINLIIHIRDKYDCFTEFNLPSISVREDKEDNYEFMRIIHSNFDKTRNESQMVLNRFVQILYGNENENDICQWFISISNILNNQSQENLLKTIQSNISAVSISVSSLNQFYPTVNLHKSIFSLI